MKSLTLNSIYSETQTVKTLNRKLLTLNMVLWCVPLNNKPSCLEGPLNFEDSLIEGAGLIHQGLVSPSMRYLECGGLMKEV